MKRIIVISHFDIDVTEGLTELVQLLPNHELIIPVTEDETFVRSAVAVAQKFKLSYDLFFSESSALVDELSKGTEHTTLCSSPLKEVIRYITSEDTLAIAWDDTVDDHMVLHSVEDFGIETWDISGPLEPIEVASGSKEDLREELEDAISNLVEVFTAFIATEVIDAIGESIERTLMEHIQDHIDPLDGE